MFFVIDIVMIKRDIYLERLIRREGNGLIKVITGVRRCGKSFLLFNLFYNYLLGKGVPEDHIIGVALDDRRNKRLRDPDNMLSFLESKICDNKPYYIILDEVQMLREFEDVLNSCLHISNADLYVTGSNSKFLSSDVITEFRGRGDEVRIYPLSFKEFCMGFEGSDEDAWDEYTMFGGLPFILSCKTDEDKSSYLVNLFKSVYLSDIVERRKVRHKEELDELTDILASAVGSFANPLKLSKTFRSVKNKNISDKTLKNYIDYLIDAFLVSKAARFDIKGKKYIGSLSKYYFEDIGLRNARLNFRQNEENHIMENIIYNELRIRGFRVDVGIIGQFGKNSEGKTIKKQLEVDFVAVKGSEKFYIQSAFYMETPEKQEQEERSLNAVGDAFKKIIVVRGNMRPRRSETGIVTMGVRIFLLDEGSMYL